MAEHSELQDTEHVEDHESTEPQGSNFTMINGLPEDSDQELLTETAYLLGDLYSEEISDNAISEEDFSIDIGTEAVIPSSVDVDKLSSAPTDLDTIVSNNPVLFNGCPLSLSTSMILIKKFQIRHKLSQEALSDMLELMKLHFPVANNFPGSLYLFNKELPFDSNGLEFVYFCSHCFSEITESAECCIHCKLPCDKGSISSFIKVPLQSQLITLLQST